ncbi:MAG TPA: cytochrome c3 family protein, partial [Geobacteraceae bacterium]
MRKSKVLLFVPLMLLLIAGIAHAAFDNSHHDMATYMTTKTSACAVCHGRLDQNTTAASSNFGNVGALCLIRCHSGTGLIGQPQPDVVPTSGPSVNPTNYTTATSASYSIVYFGGSYGHGATKAATFGGKQAVALTGAATWPYVSGATPATIECTSCHAVHDSQNAPFLWAPLAPSAAGQFDGFCDRCHSENTRSGVTPTTARASQGPHPVNFAVDNSATGAAGRTGNSRHPRSIIIQGYGTAQASRVFDVTTVDNNALKGLNSSTGHWTIGGKLTSGQNAATATWTGGASTQVMGCYTCHTVHASNANSENMLTAVAVVDTNNTTWNPLCTGCHGPSVSQAGDQVETVVGTTAWGHPVGS